MKQYHSLYRTITIISIAGVATWGCPQNALLPKTGLQRVRYLAALQD